MHAQPPSPKPRRFLRRFIAIALLLCFMPIFVFGATVAATGTVTVRVHESGPDGVDLWIPVPALLLDVAVAAAPSLLPADGLAEARREAAPYLPALRSVADELEAIPAGSVLVEVDDRGERVSITKDWRSFEILVDTNDTRIQVSIPARLLGRTLDLLG